MDFIEYYPLAVRTLAPMPTVQKHIDHMNLGMLGELGELIDAYKKHSIYGRALDLVNVKEEIGDFIWYVVNTAPTLGFDMERVALFYGNSTSLYEPVYGFDGKPEVVLEGYELTVTTLMCVARAVAQAAHQSSALPIKLPYDKSPFIAEDLMRTFASAARTLIELFGLDLSDVLGANIAKLAVRYGEKFDDFAATHRDLISERLALEATRAA